jgi:hypothetical protein
VEEQHRGRWKGRTRTNRLVFFESPEECRGRRVPVRIEWAGPWSLIGSPNTAQLDNDKAAAASHDSCLHPPDRQAGPLPHSREPYVASLRLETRASAAGRQALDALRPWL